MAAADVKSTGGISITAFFYGFLYIIVFNIMAYFLRIAMYRLAINNSSLAEIKLQSTLHIGRFIGISVTNWLMIMFSLGLLIPYAKVRSRRYLLETVHIIAGKSFDDFYATAIKTDNAIGEAAADFGSFDLAIYSYS